MADYLAFLGDHEYSPLSQPSRGTVDLTVTKIGPWDQQNWISLCPQIDIKDHKKIKTQKSEQKQVQSKEKVLRNIIKRSLRSQLSFSSVKKLRNTPLVPHKATIKQLSSCETTSTQKQMKFPFVNRGRVRTLTESLQKSLSKEKDLKVKKLYFFRELNILRTRKYSENGQNGLRQGIRKDRIKLKPLQVYL